MVAFGNPVQPHIYAKGAAHPAGTFAVTSTFADHVASGRAPGVDIGDGRCGDPVLAMKAGTISYIRPGIPGSTSSAYASIVRIKHSNGWTTGYAHLAIRAGLAVGQAVPEGYQLGTVDKIGATACHLHWGPKDPNGVEVDGWPLLAQNGATEDSDVLQGTNPVPVYNRHGKVLGDNTNFRSGPSTADPVLAKYAKDTDVAPIYEVDGALVNGSVRWYALIGNTANGKELGYLHVSTVDTLQPIEAGYSEKDLAAAKKVAANIVSAAADAAASKF